MKHALLLGLLVVATPAFADGNQPHFAFGIGEAFYSGTVTGFVHDIGIGVPMDNDLWLTVSVNLNDDTNHGDLDGEALNEFSAQSVNLLREYHPWVLGGGIGHQSTSFEQSGGDVIETNKDGGFFAEGRFMARGRVGAWLMFDAVATARIGADSLAEVGIGFVVSFTP